MAKRGRRSHTAPHRPDSDLMASYAVTERQTPITDPRDREYLREAITAARARRRRGGR